MKIAQVRANGQVQLGVLEGDEVRTASDGAFTGVSLTSLLAAGSEVLRDAYRKMQSGRTTPVTDVSFLPPIDRPDKVVCVGLNYRDHSEESGFEQPDYPAFFTRYASTLIGHGEPIVKPRASDQLDYEGEIAVIIGKGGRHIPRSDALEHVSGYSVFNDVSVRDFQFKTSQWAMGKNFDATGPFGPAYVSADELPAGIDGLRLTTRLNGKTVQDATTSDLVFKIDELVSLVSEVLTLVPGDLIVSGTPAGVGFARKPPLFMKPGDVCEVEVEDLGVLRNFIVEESASG